MDVSWELEVEVKLYKWEWRVGDLSADRLRPSISLLWINVQELTSTYYLLTILNMLPLFLSQLEPRVRHVCTKGHRHVTLKEDQTRTCRV